MKAKFTKKAINKARRYYYKYPEFVLENIGKQLDVEIRFRGMNWNGEDFEPVADKRWYEFWKF